MRIRMLIKKKPPQKLGGFKLVNFGSDAGSP